MLLDLRRIAGKEYRQEFANHHLGAIRKAISISANVTDYRRRRNYVKSLGKRECLPETEALLANRAAEIGLSANVRQEFVRLCQDRFAATESGSQRVQEGKQFYLNLLTDMDYDPNSPFMQFALREEFLNTVATYLGQAPFLQSIELIRSRPVERASPLMKSQFWHRDNHNDRRLLKMFFYATPVTHKNGPVTYLPSQISDVIPWHAGHYIPDDVMARYASTDERIEFKGEAGSTLLMDSSSLYHFGSRCEEPRLTFVIHFNSGFGYRPRTSIHERYAHRHDALSEIQRMALGF